MAAYYGDMMLLSALVPLLLIPLLAFTKTTPLISLLAPFAALPALAALLFAPATGVDLFVPSLMLGSRFGLDLTGSVFWLLAALLWTAGGLYAKHYVHAGEQKPFFLFFLAAMSGNFLLILAQEIPGFYLGFTLMSFASYGLIVARKTPEAFHAGRIYIIFIVVGETALFAGMLMAVELAGSTAFDAVRSALAQSDDAGAALALMAIGLGIKAGVLGLHSWLPLAHPVAPVPASAVLSGTMIKAGVFGGIRLFPFGSPVMTEWGSGLILFGMAAALYGAVLGTTQRDPKTLLAYSSISQVGIMTALLGLGASAPDAWPILLPGIAFYALHHGLSKGALFLGSGLCGSMHPHLRQGVWAALWLPALAIAGAPWSSGMYAKLFAKSALTYAPESLASVLPVLLVASSVATALLMARFLYLLRPAAAPYGNAPTAGMLRPWVFLLIVIVFLPYLQDYRGGPVTLSTLLQSFWPLFAAAIATLLALRSTRLPYISPVPAGDILVVAEHATRYIVRVAEPAARRLSLWRQQVRVHLKSVRRQLDARLMTYSAAGEKQLGRWSVSLTLFVTVILVIAAFGHF